MADPALPINATPQTASQLRAVLDRLRRAQVNLIAELGDLEDVFLRTGTATAAVGDGDAVYPSADGEVSPAQANSASTLPVIGIALNGAGIGEDVAYQTHGTITMAGLTVGATYFLSADTPGGLVSTPDAEAGEYIVPVGYAAETTKLIINPLISILL